MMLPTILQSLRVRLSLLLLLAISIVLTQIPLFNYLGYEFSVATALSMCLICGFLTIGLFRSQSGNLETLSHELFWRLSRENLRVHGLLLSVPLAVITANMAVVKNCSYLEGLGFYVLIPVVTTLFSIALAGLCFVVFRRSLIAYFLCLLFTLSHILWLGYFTPQIYAYNFILGFFPGLSYDEVITITPTLVGFRAVTVLVVVWCFSMTTLFIRYTSLRDGSLARLVGVLNQFVRGMSATKIIFLGTSAVMLAVWVYRVEIGFESSRAAIEHTLGRVIQTDHFTIRYAEGSFPDDEADWIAAEHEFQFDHVVRELQISSPDRITSYIYPAGEVMRRYVGTATTNIAKPWRREIHMNRDSWKNVLKHEIVHVLAGEFGMPIIRAHYNVGLIEGLAMAVEWDFGNRTLHEYAASIEFFGLGSARFRSGKEDIAQALSVKGFALNAPAISYVLNGSFSRFLIDRYGMIRFKELYGGRGFERVYGKDLSTLAQEWMRFLRRVNVQDGWREHVEFYFDRKSLFARDCARLVARLNEQGYRHLRDNQPVRAAYFFETSLLESWNSEAFSGLVRASFRMGHFDTLIQIMDDQLEEHFSNVAHLLLLYGDAQWETGNLLSARDVFEQVLRLDLTEAHTEAAALRLSVLEDAKLRQPLQPLFVESGSDSAKLALLDKNLLHLANPLLYLLKARLLFERKDYVETLLSLDQMGRPTLDRPLQLLSEKLRGFSHLRLRNWQQARLHFWQAMNHTPNEASRLRLNEWIDKCEWMGRREGSE